MDLAKYFAAYYDKYEDFRTRDKRPNEHYASGIMQDLLCQYWERTGVAPTNPTDRLGYMRMDFGNAIEKYMAIDVMSKLHVFGLHVLGTQVPAGGSEPNFNMYFDAVVVERDGVTWGEKCVIEVKVKNGIGADFFLKDFNPGDDYLAQMALYLDDAWRKKKVTLGAWVFILNSNETLGDIAFVYAKFDPKTEEITVFKAQTMSGIERPLNIKYSARVPKERARKLEAAVAAKIPPEQEFRYKDKLTPEYLANVSDYQLQKVMKTGVILGHWKPKYSSYKDLLIKNEGSSMTYTEAEMNLIRAEYLKRKPRSSLARKPSLKVAANDE